MHDYLRYGRENLPQIVALIRELVECESPSDSPSHVNRFVDLLIDRTSDIARAKTVQADGFGKHLLLDFSPDESPQEKGILGLGHSDTVWPAGTLRDMPFRESEGRLWGPGVLDMKTGLAIFVFAVRVLHEKKVFLRRPLRLLVVSDEEVGSVTSRSLIEEQARGSASVLVLEPGSGASGKLKTARKGVGRYTVRVDGKAAHAGVDPENGASAIVEAAKQIEKIAAFNEFGHGVTVNPGVIRGGTRPNVIASEAVIEIDVRVSRAADAEMIDETLKSLTAVDTRCRVQVEGEMNRPPMERSPAIAALFEIARHLGTKMGFEIEESATGGGSDGNFTAALGIPTLDGLGGVGEGIHALEESVFLNRIPERIALVAGLLQDLGGNEQSPE